LALLRPSPLLFVPPYSSSARLQIVELSPPLAKPEWCPPDMWAAIIKSLGKKQGSWAAFPRTRGQDPGTIRIQKALTPREKWLIERRKLLPECKHKGVTVSLDKEGGCKWNVHATLEARVFLGTYRTPEASPLALCPSP
jgi:hypothetical protein